MKLSRLFINDDYKGTRDYLKIQGKYELARTILYFAISISLFVAGIIATGDRMNVLTIVAILGCLPACKSAIDAFMILRFKGCSQDHAERIEQHMQGLYGLYDRVFTSYSVNFQVAHVTVKGNTICGYSQDPLFDENKFNEHILAILKKDGFQDVTVKIFTDLNKYLARLDQLRQLTADEKNTQGILNTLNSVSL